MAVKDARRTGRDRPADPAPGGHGRRAGAAAPPRRRLDRAPPGGRRARRDDRRRARGAGARAPAASRSGSATASRRSCSRPPRARHGRGARRAGRRAARRGGRAASSPARGATSARCSPGCPTTSCSRSPSASRERVARGAASARPPARAAPCPRAARAAAYHEARCALEALELGAAATGRHGATATARPRPRRDLPRPRLLPAAAVAAGRRRPAAVLRVAAGADRERRGPLRRRADALARGVHRVQRAVGGGGQAPVLPPPHAALPDPQDRGAHGPRAGLARATASSSGSPCAAASSSTDQTPEEGRLMKVGVPTEIKTDEYRVALTPSGVRELVDHGHEVVVQAGRGRGLGDRRRRLRRAGRDDPARRRGRLRRGRA